MEQLNYRTNDRAIPDEPLQRIFAERFMDLMLPDMTPGKTVLEGLAFDHEGYLYVCVPVQEILLKIDTETGEAALYRAGVYAAALPGFAFSE